MLIAPAFDSATQTVLGEKSKLRVLQCGEFTPQNKAVFNYKNVSCGLLVQEQDIREVREADLLLVTKRAPTEQEYWDMLFAWKVAKYVKSNAIVYAKNGQTIGVGAGQMSRVYSAKIANIKAADAGLEIAGSAMASDAFSPLGTVSILPLKRALPQLSSPVAQCATMK